VINLQGYGHQILLGALMTLKVAFASLTCGLVLGLLGGAAGLSRRLWLRRMIAGATGLLRGIPEFVILLICYFGLTGVLYRLTGGDVSISPFAAGVFALSIVFAAYASEAFRGAFLAVPLGQMEAAAALGLHPGQSFFLVRLPQAWRLALPSLGNQWQALLKDTSLVSVLGLEDLMRKADVAGQATDQPFTFFLTAAAIYLLFLTLSNPVIAMLERRSQRGLARVRG